MKICVYAISKNEEKFVKRWYNSVKEADKVYVLDTGSTDNTVNLLKECGVIVKQEVIKPWRFDVARNLSLDMVPIDTDICVCTDLDEVMEKGWRKKLEEVWKDDVTRAAYTYNWKLINGKPVISFYLDKIHKRKGYRWTHPVHETLTYDGDEVKILNEDIVVDHFPDESKSRSSYLPLLELSVKEDPLDDRNMHYLGREYMYYGKWNEAIDTLIKHLNLERAIWKDERCASMRFIGRCYLNLNRPLEAEMWYKKAIDEAPHLKEPYSELGLFYYKMGKYEEAKDLFLKALNIKQGYKSYITEYFSKDFYIYDVLSICEYYLGNFEKSLEYIDKALQITKDPRIIENRNLISKKIDI